LNTKVMRNRSKVERVGKENNVAETVTRIRVKNVP
jgi:hypothetical protein